MQFTKLQLSGFKSFVDPIEISIDRGVTGIVGPNGCGKSNLVEALRWVMGENSAKRMRGSEMDDVIFAGSATRPGRNLAEVNLVLDNSARKAPAMCNDQDTLEVTRQIERGSGSTYRINGKEVRARDVQLLFADAATGAHSTAMVSQGRIGALINAKPTDRRTLLEEAAGITGLHSRRHEAELRLRAAETNLERLDDVVTTLETQLQSLKKQARQASRYRNLADHIRRHEAIALHLEAEAVKAQLIEARDHLGEAERQVASLTEGAAAHAAEQADAAAALPQLRDQEARAAAALQRLLVDRDNLDREEAQVTAAMEQAESRRGHLERDRARAKAQAEDANAAQAGLDRERAELEAASAGEAEAIAEAEDIHGAARKATQALEAEVEATAERVAADEAKASALHRRIEELSARLERLGTQAEEIGRTRETLTAQRVDDTRLEAGAAAVSAANVGLERAQSDAEASDAALGASRETESKTRETMQHAESARAKLEAEAAALSAILEPSDTKDWKPLVDEVTVEAGYEAALGSALGDDIAAPGDPAAPIHWQALTPYGAVAALPAGAEALSGHVSGPAVLARRLSQIGVVPDSATGARLQAELAPGQRLVTREGALWRWDGFTVATDARTAAGKRLAQRNRLSELRRILTDASDAASAAHAAHDAARVAFELASAKERAARADVTKTQNALHQARQAQGEMAQEAAAVVSRLAGLDESAARIAGDIAEVRMSLNAARQEAEDIPDLAAARALLGEIRDRMAQSRATLAEHGSALDRLIRDAEARHARLAANGEEKQSWARRSEDAERHIGELDERLKATGEEIDALAARPEELRALREVLAEQLAAAESRRAQAADGLALGETRMNDADKALKAAEGVLGSAREDRVRAEAAVSQADQSLDNVTEKVRDRLDCKLEGAIEIAGLDPSQELPERDAIETKLARLVRERETLGAVNLRAEDEARELDQQINSMQSERADLVAAISRLRHGISSLNREGRERLLAAFAKVEAHFSELFVRLFGGGKAHLKLTGSDDPLEAGLEILASPPGKRLQVMSLLSGGEQALTALSLLFAVFLTNPAPICVLDEVDAPLDDANVDRFCTLLDELCESGTTRFLIITHHRMTMSRVDRLYGVTMAERGISRLVSVDLGAAEDLRESA